MEFVFTDEQNMIRDTAESFLQEVSTSAAIRDAMATERGYDPALWQTVCTDLVWQAIHTPEDCGGMGLGYVELVAMQEQMGRFLFCSPYFSSVCLGINALLVAGSAQQQQQYLPEFCAGKTATLAFAGAAAAARGGRWDVATVDATFTAQGEHYQLNGRYEFVTDGASADYLILAARDAASQADEGIHLFIAAADTKGIERELLPTMDQTRKWARIKLNNVTLPKASLLGDESKAVECNGAQSLAVILDLATIALAAEQMGGAQQLLDMTVAYSKERNQFGRAIAGFQAIKHKAADMMLRVEVARSGVYYAACVAEEALQALQAGTPVDGAALQEAASVAKAYCSDAFFKNASEAIQIHGGVGFTWEYDVHLYFKRAKASEQFLGTGAWHRERLAALLLDGEGVL
ncbi:MULTISPECIES: acyl-CoA dehydrogenase family protein [unclassified Ketobacter]|uniref:acyl-CoA dehydrogenase family protein n=1 Tax=unclassified Ketobacter TaxID=2639109 RepID=UPI000F2DAC9B|nr:MULTISPECIES: acyl-CoA dehydrogenase family protein [unclassified Ketobacter]RLT89407.1 MAG: acyl-CoA dehydrogenase [Ketobacter sp. GenoA1]RLT95746.1 MAG: acyl-CoA dehydrogenase [Ketobacter sp.]